MKILITGATGFLGHWITKRLVDEGHQCFALIRKPSDESAIRALNATPIFGDITDRASLGAALKDCEGVFHLAGLIAYKRSERAHMDQVNVQGTRNVIDAVLTEQVSGRPIRVVYFSSVTAIGAGFTPSEILNENSPYNVSHLNLGYFETKHQAELEIQSAVQTRGLNCAIINPATVYGPMDSLKGSRGSQLKVAQGRFPFYPPGGVNIVHVDDVVELAIRLFRSQSRGERVIAGSENLLIKDVFHRIARAANVNPPELALPKWAIHRIGGVGDQLEKFGLKGPINSETAWTSTLFHWFDNSKARTQFGISFKSADEAIEASVRWSKDNGMLS